MPFSFRERSRFLLKITMSNRSLVPLPGSSIATSTLHREFRCEKQTFECVRSHVIWKDCDANAGHFDVIFVRLSDLESLDRAFDRHATLHRVAGSHGSWCCCKARRCSRRQIEMLLSACSIKNSYLLRKVRTTQRQTIAGVWCHVTSYLGSGPQRVVC